MLRGTGLEPLLLPARSPNLNAYAERCALDQKRVLGPDRTAGGKTISGGPSWSTSPTITATEPPRSWQCAAQGIA